MTKRKSNEILYSETYKMLLRGLLFNAPDSLREQYEKTLLPISLGGNGTSNESVVTQKEIYLVEQYVKAMQAVPIPTKTNLDEEGDKLANAYVKNIIEISKFYAEKLDYFKSDLETIMGNIRTRTIVLELEQSPELESKEHHLLDNFTEHTSSYRETLVKIMDTPQSELEDEEAAREKALEDFLNDDLPSKTNSTPK